ncbi:transporter [Legionella sp. 16cNR16C]|uniref:transporter n=1 Tax=Legionella sp. 16cNR16C TaxID=2905656 RepID=UPI001E359EC0|nr:transporter [Legionella sp. 16cNR16C]MCE3044796.1 transporter [Legionella sp. 16cNR16C]
MAYGCVPPINSWLTRSILVFLIASNSAFADEPVSSCSGPTAFLNLIDRPNYADSSCTVPWKSVIIESGYQYQRLTDSDGTLQTYPNMETRFGLPGNNELYVLWPTYNQQSFSPRYGNSETMAGLKHMLINNNKWVIAVEAELFFPDGSAAYGSKSAGGGANAILTYTINPKWSVTTMLGVSSLTQSRFNGGERYNNFIPDFVLSYSLSDRLSAYGEVYGETKTGPGEHSGFNADAGILFLITPSIIIDINAGQRISGYPGSFENYFGAGISFMI